MTKDATPTVEIKRRRRPAQVRLLLLESAVDIFAKHGYSGASTKEIAQAADVSESTLFRHFRSKNELFTEAAIAPFEGFLQEISQWVTSRDEWVAERDLIHDIIDYLYRSLAARRDLLLALLSASEHPDMSAAVGDLQGRLATAIFDPLVDMARYRATQRQITVDPHALELTARTTVGMIAGMVVLDRLLLPGGWKYPTDEVMIQELVNYCLAGGSLHRYDFDGGTSSAPGANR